MKKGLAVLCIFVITITFGIFEIVNVKKSLISFEDMILDMSIKYENNEENINNYYGY